MADRTLCFGVGVGARHSKSEAARDIIQIAFNAVDRRIAPVLDLRQAVHAKEAELKSVPDLMIDRAVPAQPAAEEGRFPAHFVIGQEVRSIRQRVRLSVDSARAEAPRPGRVEHESRRWFPLRVEPVNVARALASTRNRFAVYDVRNVVAWDVQAAGAGRQGAAQIIPTLKSVNGQTAILASAEAARIAETEAGK